MLQYKIGKRNGGFVLWGDYGTLKPIHSFLMDISEKCPTLESEGLIPALAFDLRKAYEGQREKSKTDVWDDEISIYGVEQVWPTFIVQIALLRTGLAFVDSSKQDQSIMYQLESYMESVLKAAFPKEFHILLNAYKGLIGTQEKSISEILGSRVALFLFQEAKTRKSLLPEILQSLDLSWSVIHRAIESEKGALTLTDFEKYSWDSLDNITEKQFKL
jgi:hypothetical protein